MPTVRIEYYGVDGEGRNVTEAKQDAGRKITKAMSGSYTPRVLSAGGETIIVFRSPDGWRYGFLRDGDLSGLQGQADDREEVERHARKHLGSNVTDWRTCFDADGVDQIVKDARDRREIATSCKWQRDYHTAKDAGLDDTNARYWISGLTHLMTQPIPAGLTLST
jgi:hypothetical protein